MQNEPAASNADQRRYWNEKGGPAWLANEEMYDEELAPLVLPCMLLRDSAK